MCSNKVVFLGFIVSSKSLGNLETLNGFLAVENGKITKIGTKTKFQSLEQAGDLKEFTIVKLQSCQFLMPGLVDCHTHAPQFPNIGLGLDRPLLEWLDKYTFPLEKKYSDEKFAASVYDQVVKRLLKNGTTTACYFGSIHLNGTMELVYSAVNHGQRALVGKVSMNKINDAGYFNETTKELQDTEEFLKNFDIIKSDLVEPIITPRFAVSCDDELMSGLAKLADKYNCRIQSHISENTGEIDYVLQTNPDSESYTDVYDKNKILTKKCIMAHAVHLSEKEMATLSARGVSVAHCPASNTRLMSGLCPVRKILEHGINVGLGTDVSGGDSATILDAMRRSMDVAAHLQLGGNATSAISWKEAFYLATLGGATALNLEHKIGSFEVGKEFDALLIDTFAKGGPTDYYDYSVDKTDEELMESLVQRFVYLGDDRNILKVYIKAVEVKDEDV